MEPSDSTQKFLNALAATSLIVNYALNFYVYLAISQQFRAEFYRIWCQLYRRWNAAGRNNSRNDNAASPALGDGNRHAQNPFVTSPNMDAFQVTGEARDTPRTASNNLVLRAL